MPQDIILETRGLSKEFRGFLAVRDVDLRVRRGSIHALIGPNGAGKTTVFNLLTKFHSPTAGKIFFNGMDITQEEPAQIARCGIVRSFHTSAVFPQLTVLENVKIALQRKLGVDYHFWRSIAGMQKLDAPGMALLKQVSLARFSSLLAGDLPYGRKRTLEIATTLALDPELLLLDEPTQGMGHEDVDRIKDLIKRVAADRTPLMVEHNMKVVADINDTITVLQRGEVLIVTLQNHLAALGGVVTIIIGMTFIVCVSFFRRGLVGELQAFLQRRNTKQHNVILHDHAPAAAQTPGR